MARPLTQCNPDILVCCIADLPVGKMFDIRRRRFPVVGKQIRRPLTRGFTLTELLIVVVLVGVMTAVIVPEMRGTYEDAVLRSMGRQLVNVCHLASSRAVTASQLYRVRIDMSQRRYLLEKLQEGAGRQFVPVRDVSGSQGEWDTRISIDIRSQATELVDETETEAANEEAPSEDRDAPSTAMDTIAFYPDGTADAKELVLRDRTGFRLALRINPNTGRVRLAELERN